MVFMVLMLVKETSQQGKCKCEYILSQQKPATLLEVLELLGFVERYFAFEARVSLFTWCLMSAKIIW